MKEKRRDGWWSSQEGHTKTNLIVVGLAVAVCVVGALWANFMVDSYKAEIEQSRTELDSLQGYAEEAKAVSPYKTDEVRDAFADAQKKGKAVAEAQTKYLYIDGDGDEVETAVTNVKDSFRPFIDEGSSDQVHMWHTSYVPMNVEATWRFLPMYGMTADGMPVVWVLSDKDGATLCWCTGVYDVESGLFKDIRPKVTSVGMTKYLDDSNAESAKAYWQNQVDAIDEATGEFDHSNDDWDNVRDAREQLREQYESEQGGE